jgi:hypothetical protein
MKKKRKIQVSERNRFQEIMLRDESDIKVPQLARLQSS